jgi:hypothetical protein
LNTILGRVDGTNSQDEMLVEKDDLEKQDVNTEEKNKKNKGKGADLMEGIRKSTRLESNEDIKIIEKAISRVVAKDAFLNKGTSSNPFSVLNYSDISLIEIDDLLNISLGKNREEVNLNLNEIKMVEMERFVVCDSNSIVGNEVNITNVEMEYEIFDSIDKMVQDLLDSESEKEKMMVHNRKEDSPNVRCTPNKRRINKKRLQT